MTDWVRGRIGRVVEGIDLGDWRGEDVEDSAQPCSLCDAPEDRRAPSFCGARDATDYMRLMADAMSVDMDIDRVGSSCLMRHHRAVPLHQHLRHHRDLLCLFTFALSLKFVGVEITTALSEHIINKQATRMIFLICL